MKRTVAVLLGCIFALGLFSCRSDDNDYDDENISILVNGAETVSAVEAGQQVLLRLSNSVSATWSVNDTSVATLSAASGVSVYLSAQRTGSVTVTATAGGKSYVCALQITTNPTNPNGGEATAPNGGETNEPNVTFVNASAYKVIVCRDGLVTELATVESGATKSVYVAPGANEIILHFRYSYCVIDDADSGMVWLDVADSTAYTYPVDSADIVSGSVQVCIPAPKTPQFSAAYLKLTNQSDTPISLYNGNTQQKLYRQEKYYIQPGHSGVYSIPPDAPFDDFTLGATSASATPIAPFYAVSGVLYQCTFSEECDSVTATEKDWLRELFTVTFETNGGSAISPLTASLLEATLIPATTLQGYYFAGWYTDPELQRAATFPCVMTADTTLYAKWLENTHTAYTVRHFLQNTDRSTYTLQDTDPQTGTTGAATLATAKTYRGFTAQPFAQGTIAADGTTVIAIYYDRNAYTVTFDANNGTGDSKRQTFYYGVPQNLNDNTFTRSDHTFIGWAFSATDNPVYSNQAEFTGTYTSGVTLYAIWGYGITVTADTIESIDLTNIIGDYILKVTGNISQSTLVVLANKMKISNVSITLDLSEATGLTAISATSDSKSIFADCPLNSVVLPETLETIGTHAFYMCNMKSVTIPSNVRTIGRYAFCICGKLETLEINGLETLDDNAFQYCKNLESVVLKNITTIEYGSFSDCTNLSSVTIEAVDTIGTGAFRNCTNLSSVTIEAVDTIGACAFEGCTNLSSITIDAKSIGYKAFKSCTALTAVTIGKNVKSIDNSGDGCFNGCQNLTSVYFEDTEDWYYKYSSSGNAYKKDVTNAATNASNLKYSNYLWYKE